MRRLSKSTSLLACCSILCLAAGTAFGQRTTAPRTSPTTRGSVPTRTVATTASSGVRSPVAVADIGFIFKNHERFKATMEKMKTEVQAYEAKLREEHESLTKERDNLARFKPGSPDFKKLEQSLAERAAQLQVETQLKKKEFLEREANVYYHVYMEVYNAIREYADMQGIVLVLRHNGEGIDPQDRASVLQGVNRAVVYERNLDITREILNRLNRVPSVTNRQRAGAPATR